jgi:VIT1/CCC1 family predicted Fe2+/Mn2+ transporter
VSFGAFLYIIPTLILANRVTAYIIPSIISVDE